jgi:GntR family transcriptional regulator / MocR family aminotransferase
LKRAQPVLLPPLTLDRRRPLGAQVASGIRVAIASGRLKAGDRLPASRKLAGALGISRQLVVAAYEELILGGYVRGRTGDGSYVAVAPPDRNPPERVINDPDGYSISLLRLP